MSSSAILPQTEYYFLQGGAELGDLTRGHDWASSPIGAPDSWPHSLRTSVSTVLNSAFPMLLFWGDDLVCFYNDAFRPSLGVEGRHPSVGRPGAEMWKDIWEFVGPLLAGVRATGQPVYFENQLVPFYRNGKIEEIYWTFSYSAVHGENGKVEGVMVVCHETTREVMANKKLRESESRFQQLVDEAAVGIVVLDGPELNVQIVNEAYARMIGRKAAELKGHNIFDVIPETKPYFGSIIESVRQSGGSVHLYDHPYFVFSGENKIEGYADLIYQPYRDSDNNTEGVMVICHDVTEKVIAKRKLEESERQLRSVLDAAPYPIGIYTGREMRIQMVNQAIIDAWGKGPDVIGKTFKELLPELADLEFPKQLESVFDTGVAFRARNRRVDLMMDGELQKFYFNYDYVPLFDTEGKVYGVMNTAADVTEVNLAKERLEESEHRVRSIILSSPFPVALYLGREMRIEIANQSIIDIWGKGNDVVGDTYYNLLPELESQHVYKNLDGVFTSGVPFNAYNQKIDLVVDGKLKEFYFNYSFTPLFDKEGKVYGVVNTAADVTDLNLAKRQVEEKERNLRNIILQSPVATCIYRGDNYVIEIANNAMFEFWGVEGKDVLNKPLFEAMPEVAAQGFEEIMANVLRTGETFVANEMAATLKREGKPKSVYINFSLEPIREADNSISGIMAVAVDVTTQVQARRAIEEVVNERTMELATANENLRRSNAELEQFAYIASHDLQEPLRKVTTFTQLLEMSLGQVPDEAQSYLQKINSSTERMAGLIRDVLHYSQLSRDESRALRAIDLNELLEVIKTDYELLIQQKGAELECKELPTIEALPRQMSQLFSNLISNALKFARAGVAPVIKISAALMTGEEVNASGLPTGNAPYYKIEVKDNGIGFDQQYANKIFNIFQRLHGKTEYTGTGIGLAMCKKIALNHHGDIYAHSAAGQGAVFTVILPAKQDRSVQ